MQSQPQSQPQRSRRHTMPLRQPPSSPPIPQIPNLFTQLTQNFHLLQQSYLTAHTKQQQSLLNSFIKTFNEILNQVVQAQERVYLIDCQDIKDDKCIGYLGQIAIYRDECMRNKAKLREKMAVLEKERQRTGKIGGEAREMGVLCMRKGEELERLREEVEKGEERIRQKGEKDIQAILQNIQKQQQDPQKSKQYFSNPKRAISKTSRSTRIREQIQTNKQLKFKLNLDLNLNLNLKPNTTPNRSPNPRKPKSIDSKTHQQSPIHSNIFSHRLQNSANKKLDGKINQLDLLNVSTMNDTLWLYKPASIRKNKYAKDDVKSTTLSILENMKRKNQENKRKDKQNEEDCLFEQAQSQQSTKKDSQMIKSQIQQAS